MQLGFPKRLGAITTALAITLLEASFASAEPSRATVLSGTNAQPAVDLQHGVAVVALGSNAIDSAWDLAGRVYSDPLLRPAQMDDARARVLAGEEPTTPTLRDLAEARKALRLGDPLTSRLCSSIAAELGKPALVLVYKTSSQPRAQLYQPGSNTFLPYELWPQPDAHGVASWESTSAWLHAHALSSRKPKPVPQPQTNRSILASGWFWGAIGAAAGAAVLAVTILPDSSSDTIHVQGRVGP